MTEYLGFNLDELCDCVYANQPYSFFEDEEHCRTMLHKYFDNYPNRDDVSHEEVAKKFFEDCMPELCKMYKEHLIWIMDCYIPRDRCNGIFNLRMLLKNPPKSEICERAVDRARMEIGIYDGELVVCSCGCVVSKFFYPNASRKKMCEECLDSLD